MDVKEYIASGILESYTLGLASEQERREVECMRKIYPEIDSALQLADADMESFASGYAVKAPSGLKSKIMADIAKTEQDPSMKAVASDDSDEADPKLPPASGQSQRSAWGGWAAAAAVIAIAFGIWQYTESVRKSDELAAMRTEQKALNDKLGDMENQIAELSEGVNELYSPQIKKVVMDAVKDGESTQVAVFWNQSNGQVKLDPSSLPELPADKQYQLWVLEDGNPIDMGVLPKEASEILLAQKTSIVGDAFAITVEPLGGKPQPTLEQLVVLGKVA